MLERLKQGLDLNIGAHTAPGGSQIKGTGAGALRKILAQFGETRPFLREGGRTNRGLRGDIDSMLDALKKAGLATQPLATATVIIRELQAFLVDEVRKFHGQQRLQFTYNPSKTTAQMIADLLGLARQNQKAPAVTQYLVGAKLQLRFPEEDVSNRSYSTADEQLAQPGDFLLGDTAFHVTVSPGTPLLDKCVANLDAGRKVYVLVPDEHVLRTRALAESAAPGRISVESVESFVAQNLDELSAFSAPAAAQQLRLLLETYNRRVDEIEPDKSMLVKIPSNLPAPR